MKCVKGDMENVGHEADSYGMGKQGHEPELRDGVNQEINISFSVENGAEKDGKVCCEDGVQSTHGRKKTKLNGNEEITSVKDEFFGRVLRSRSASAFESQKVGCGLDKVVQVYPKNMVSAYVHSETDSVDKSSKAMKINRDDSDVVLVTTMKRKRGRPPKVKVQSETIESDAAVVFKALDKSQRLVKTNSDDSDVVQVTTLKRKRGRPSKVNAKPDMKAETKAFETNFAAVTKVKCKRGRGRPPKLQVRTEADDSDGTEAAYSNQKQDRPPKIQVSETPVIEELQELDTAGVSKAVVVMKKKHGRCPKSEVVLSGILKKPKTRGPFRLRNIHKNSKEQKVVTVVADNSCVPHASKYDSDPDHGVNSKNIDPLAEKKMERRGSHSKRPTSSVEEKNGDFGDGSDGASSRTNLLDLTVRGEEKMEEFGRYTEKQLVREQIKNMLLSAGWTIDYRPRIGRDYSDAVYISPQRRAYWSATLAYSVLKSHCENLDAGRQNLKPGFKFKPIPEEVMNMLTRTTKKKKLTLAKQGHPASEVSGRLNQKLKKNERLRKLEQDASETFKSSKKIGTKKHSMSNAGRNHEVQSQMFSVESSGKFSRSKSKNAKTKRRRALLVRNSEEGIKGSSSSYMYPGKRMVLNWMIDIGTVPLDSNVNYRGQQQKTRRTHGGRIARNGIYCDCCNEIVSLADFEVHARGKSDYPSKHIYLEDGTSLLQCQMLAWDKQEESQRKGFHYVNITCDDPNDDSCGICGNGGELICCDSCTSTFHLDCLKITKYPSGEWHCLYCSCKFCGKVGVSCQADGDKTALLSTCRLCEAKYHKSCIQIDHSTYDAVNFSSFCGTKCQEVFVKMMSLVGVKNDLTDGYSWTLVRRFDIDSDSNLSGMPRNVECNSKLALALSIMDECFLPIVDHRTGIDLIHNVVYNCGSNFTRLNYSGFYTVILEKGDELVSAASIRVHGDGLAEMPFIGTRHIYRRQGMCGRLLGAIENALKSVGVQKLVIPAISELLQTWTSVFGFKPIIDSERNEMKNVNLLVFPCIDMLQKTILETSKEHEATIPKDRGSEEDAGGEHNNLSTLTTTEHESSCFDGGVSPRATCSNAGSETARATQVVPEQLNEANQTRADSSPLTSFHSTYEGSDADQLQEVSVVEPPKSIPVS